MEDAAPHAAIPGSVRTLFWETQTQHPVCIAAFGKYYPNTRGMPEKQNWSLRKYVTQESGRLGPEYEEPDSIQKYLPKIGYDLGVSHFLAPSPREFNALVCSTEALTRVTIEVVSPLYHKTAWLLRGALADGVVLTPGSGYALSPGGCPVVLVHDRAAHLLGVAHAGMRSLIDESRLKAALGEDVNATRKTESVLCALLEAMQSTPLVRPNDLYATILFPISAEVFTYHWQHPVFGALNRKRSEYISSRWGPECTPGFTSVSEALYGSIDLGILAMRQLEELGIPSLHISVVPAPPKALWYDTREVDEDPHARDLVCVRYGT